MSLCPYCKKQFNAASITPVTGRSIREFGRTFALVSYDCPSCHTSLGIGADPQEQCEDIASAVMRRLQTPGRR